MKYGWQHGWLPSYVKVNPFIVAGFSFNQEKSKKSTFCVALKCQQKYLETYDLKSIAIGHPIAYFDLTIPTKLERKKNTILIVPAHGFTNEDSNGFYDFNCINEVIKKYSNNNSIYVLAHQHDYKTGRYNEYEEIVNIIKGSLMEDSNTFIRMKYIFSQFEYACFGSFTSAIIYASLFGCKSFLAENYFLPSISTYLEYNSYTYCGSRKMVAESNFCYSRQEILDRYPFVGNSLESAGCDLECAEYELGFNNKLTKQQANDLIIESQGVDSKVPFVKKKTNSLFRKLGWSLPFPE